MFPDPNQNLRSATVHPKKFAMYLVSVPVEHGHAELSERDGKRTKTNSCRADYFHHIWPKFAIDYQDSQSTQKTIAF